MIHAACEYIIYSGRANVVLPVSTLYRHSGMQSTVALAVVGILLLLVATEGESYNTL